jgi:disulfide oxidoreductase YuzD
MTPLQKQFISLYQMCIKEAADDAAQDLKKVINRRFPNSDLDSELPASIEQQKERKPQWVEVVPPKTMASPIIPITKKVVADNKVEAKPATQVQFFDVDDFIGLNTQEILDKVGDVKKLRANAKKIGLTIDFSQPDEKFVDSFIKLINGEN